uniref:Alpha-conotoxin-like PuSG1.2 n=1 Tax=Conus pulicarius TaxID=93154 RepID=CA1S2_CONPL|nr:RecName: Full=Alpha-conotoxin-like PuSG1.2; Flags: Precursor [Conus pulicarius]
MRCLALLVVTLLLFTATATTGASNGMNAAASGEAPDSISLAVRDDCCPDPACRQNHPEICPSR